MTGFRKLLVLTAAAIGMLCAAGASAADPAPKSAFTPAQREELKKLFHDYIMQNPEIIREAVTALQAKDEADRTSAQKNVIAANRKALMQPAENTVIGNPKGDVTLVEFFDYNCGYCKAMFPAMMETIKNDGKVRLVMKEFPILSPSSVTASKAALAAVKQDKYTQFHMALLGHKGSLSDDTIMTIARDVGLDVAKLQADMKAPEIEKTIAANTALAGELKIDGTPALIVGDQVVDGAQSQDKLKELIAAARKKS
jgi:protein-disulfide isomerase